MTIKLGATAATLALALAGTTSLSSAAERQTVPLTDGWRFVQGDTVSGAEVPGFDDGAWAPVSVPHTWNRAGYYTASGPHVNSRDNLNTTQGVGWYRLTFTPPASFKDKAAWLQFDAASRKASVWLNGVHLGDHAGGFSRFRLDASKAIKPGQANSLVVKVDATRPAAGGPTADILPLGGDFFVHGGLYRSVTLVATDKAHFDMLDFGGPGVYARTTEIRDGGAKVAVRARLRNDATRAARLTLVTQLVDAAGGIAAEAKSPVNLKAGAATEVSQDLALSRAHLWQGVKDPYLYRLRAELRDAKGVLIDSVDQAYGVREIRIDPEKGLFLNGEHLALHGVGLHQDHEGKGWAISDADVAQDMAIIREMGANTIRLTHYQHGQAIHDLADRYGLILWDEIPFVSVMTLAADQVEPTPGLVADAKQQLRELIRQNSNHASVAVWGIANEVDLRGTPPSFMGAAKIVQRDPIPFLKELQALAKSEDPTRPTTQATCCEGLQPNAPEVAAISDVSGANRYFGWYYTPSDPLGPALDALRKKRPDKPLSVSEYGAGGAISQHTDDPLGGPFESFGRIQPEEYQAYVHEKNWAILSARPYLFATWLWNSFDFATGDRHEGDAESINTKGLVTYDRQVKKDAFYFYKANWSAGPSVHIAGRRYVDRAYPVTDVKVYSNAPSTELVVNGRSLGALADCPQKICVWKDVRLAVGDNTLVGKGQFSQGATEDRLTWRLAPQAKDRFTIDSGAILAPIDASPRHGSDAFFAGGAAKTVSGPAPAGISGWSTARTFREGDFSYQIPAAPGRYTVTLTFVEPIYGKGERTFDVLVGDKAVLSNLDVASLATGEHAIVTRSFPVEVSAPGLTLSFKGKTGKAMVSAVDVAPRP
ncbi:glycoside hydrolase family 2 TIM barrel-domain containing protein [Caulobacter sp. BK020]|uniref:glycoside hydrolase family 2 TIM barrel-domain containing protein n=1 Tax=Caulobacter sp. BK020 TaxID=2512117 RepID=UPI00104E72FF|nr:glycoside hydrolase family 2 TIM barrel-domain containing protein [Caulobacter sp. BK020]TCS14930.1 beta-galactosidase [Caulobacter sp. BK020]